MPYELTHSSTEELMHLKSKTIVGFFFDAVRGTMELLRRDIVRLKTDHVTRKLSVEGADRSAVLVHLLTEVLALANAHNEIYPSVKFRKLTETEVEAELEGLVVENFDQDVKSVRAGNIPVAKGEDGNWSTDLIFEL